MVTTTAVLSNESKITGLTDSTKKLSASDSIDFPCATVLLLYLILILIILAIVLFISPTIVVLSAVCVYSECHGAANIWCPGLIPSIVILIAGSMNVCLLGCIFWWLVKEWLAESTSDDRDVIKITNGGGDISKFGLCTKGEEPNKSRI